MPERERRIVAAWDGEVITFHPEDFGYTEFVGHRFRVPEDEVRPDHVIDAKE